LDFHGDVNYCLTISSRLGLQPILFRIQSILLHGTVVNRAGPVVQHKIAPLMTFNRSQAFICRANSTQQFSTAAPVAHPGLDAGQNALN
jgi:hypothetical protein